MNVIDKYVYEMTRVMKRAFPYMTNQDLEAAIRYSVSKRYKEQLCKVDNNYKHVTDQMTLLKVANYIQAKQPICTSYGVMFKNHTKIEHPLMYMIRTLMEARDKDKALMFKYLDAHDYEKAASYKMDQLLDKRNCNALYGCMGNKACMLYNLYIASSTTTNGRSMISTATMFFESFLSNNVNFGSLEEVLHFIDNVCSESGKRKFKDSEILDFDVSPDLCFAKVMKNCYDWRKGTIKWVVSFEDAQIIYRTIKNLSQEDRNRVFYKNNLYAFIDNRVIKNAIIYILKSLKEPFLAPAKVPEEIKVELDILQDFLEEYVFYDYLYIDRIDRCDNMIKNVCLISDTDSTIVSFDGWYHFVLNMIMGEDIRLTSLETNVQEYIASKEYKSKTVPKVELRYDFYTDEVIEKESMKKPFVLIPQNNIRYSIINIIAYICGNLVNKHMLTYTKHCHTYGEDRKCLLYFKNEFLFSRALLTGVKKNYATNWELQEGVRIEQTQDHSLDIKGMPINKSVMNKAAKKRLQTILYNDILRADHIDQIKILEKIAIFEKEIKESLQSGSKDYFKPARIKAMESYADPMRIQGIKAAVIWNKIKDPELEEINLEAINTISIAKVKIDPTNVGLIRDKFPAAYDRLCALLSDAAFFGKNKPVIECVGLPTDVETPEWLMDFIDYNGIINDNVGNFPFESININRMEVKNVNYSMMMKL